MSIKEAIHKALKNGGVTYNWYIGKEFTREDAIARGTIFAACHKKGVVVSMKHGRVKYEMNTIEAVARIIGKNNGSFLIGIWVETDNIYVDSTVMFSKEDDAINFCKLNDQVAYYDFMTQRSVYLNKETV